MKASKSLLKVVEAGKVPIEKASEEEKPKPVTTTTEEPE